MNRAWCTDDLRLCVSEFSRKNEAAMYEALETSSYIVPTIDAQLPHPHPPRCPQCHAAHTNHPDAPHIDAQQYPLPVRHHWVKSRPWTREYNFFGYDGYSLYPHCPKYCIIIPFRHSRVLWFIRRKSVLWRCIVYSVPIHK